MIIRRASKAPGQVRITFALPDDGRPVSVVGDFNDWDPFATPLRKRTNGTRSAAVDLDEGSEVSFRYLYDGGEFVDDPEVDVVANGYGETHSVLLA